jgi:hypothetical protein
VSTEAPGITISGCGCMDEANARAEWPRGEVPCVCKQSGHPASTTARWLGVSFIWATFKPGWVHRLLDHLIISLICLRIPGC